MPQTLAQQVRAKYPGVYDDLSDADLDAKVRAKYPGAYDDLPKSDTATPTAGSTSFLDLAVSGVKGVIDGVNPLPILKSLYDDASGEFTKAQQSAASGDVVGALGHAVAGSPVGGATKLLGRMGKAQIDQFAKAKQAYDEGRYSEALGYTAAGVTPVVGPMAAAAGEEIGTGDPLKAAHGVGLAASVFAPKAVGAVLPRSIKIPGTGKFANPNPADAAAARYGQGLGITRADVATGSPVVGWAQWAADRSLGGAIPAHRAAAREAAALTGEAQALATRAHPAPVTPETAGASLRGSLESTVKGLHGEQAKQYGKFRDIEAAQAEPVQVGTKTVTREFPADLAEMDQHEALLRAVADAGGIGLDKGMPGEIRQLWESRSRGQGTIDRMRTAGASQESVQHGNAIGGISGVIKRTGGKTLDHIAENLRERGFDIAGPNDVLAAVEEARVARMRPAATRAGQVDTFEEPVMETMGLPVDVESAQTMLRPIYDELMREKDITPIMGKEGRALAALDRLMRGPKIAPASVVDGALSKLKAFARSEGMSELRGEGQSIAARAVSVLEARVQEAAARGGPEATAARNAGRAATIQKVAVGKLVKDLKTEPVKAYRQATLPQDTGIDYLRQIQHVAPAELPKVGRALLSDIFERAQADKGLGKTATPFNEWQKVGPETRKLLFPDPEHLADVDKFFRLTKRMSENPNPSGTAYGAALTTQAGFLVNPSTAGLGAAYTLTSAMVAKLLRSKAGVRALTEVIQVPTGRSRLARAAAVSRVATLAGARPVPVPVTAEAERK